MNKFSLLRCMQLARPKAEGQTWKQTKAQQIFFFLLPVCSQSYLIGSPCNFWVVLWKIIVCTKKFHSVCHQLTEVVNKPYKMRNMEVYPYDWKVLWCPCRYRKDVAIYLLFFIVSSDLYRRIYSFLLLFDIKCYIYFGAPISTKFRSILLPNGIRLVRTCWFFSSLR